MKKLCADCPSHELVSSLPISIFCRIGAETRIISAGSRDAFLPPISIAFCLRPARTILLLTMITIQLTVPAAQGAPRVPLEIDETITARDLRQEASKATKIPQSSIKLIFRGRLITESDQAAVTEYKLEEGSVLHCMGKPAANGEASSNAAAASTAASATSTNLPTVSVPSSSSVYRVTDFCWYGNNNQQLIL